MTDEEDPGWSMPQMGFWKKRRNGELVAEIWLAPATGGWTVEVWSEGRWRYVNPPTGIRWDTADDAKSAAEKALQETRT